MICQQLFIQEPYIATNQSRSYIIAQDMKLFVLSVPALRIWSKLLDSIQDVSIAKTNDCLKNSIFSVSVVFLSGYDVILINLLLPVPPTRIGFLWRGDEKQLIDLEWPYHAVIYIRICLALNHCHWVCHDLLPFPSMRSLI